MVLLPEVSGSSGTLRARSDAPPSDVYCQQVSGNLTPCPRTYVFPLPSSHHMGMSASHSITRRVSTAQYGSLRARERPQSLKFITVHCYSGILLRLAIVIMIKRGHRSVLEKPRSIWVCNGSMGKT